MRRVIAILFILLLTAQFVQITMNFSQSSYAVALDEEQKEKMGKEEIKEAKEVVPSSYEAASSHYLTLLASLSYIHSRLSKPYLHKHTPPPDYAG